VRRVYSARAFWDAAADLTRAVALVGGAPTDAAGFLLEGHAFDEWRRKLAETGPDLLRGWDQKYYCAVLRFLMEGTPYRETSDGRFVVIGEETP
jgi:hypothetical protein